MYILFLFILHVHPIMYRLTPSGCAGSVYSSDGSCGVQTCSATSINLSYTSGGCPCSLPPRDDLVTETSQIATPGVCAHNSVWKCLAASNLALTSAPTAPQTLPSIDPLSKYFSYIDRITGVKAGYGLNVCTAYSANSGLSIMYRRSPNVLANLYGPGLHAIGVSVTKYHSSTTCSGNKTESYSICHPVSAASALAAGKTTYGEYSMDLPQHGGASGAILKK
jgi:hypothetical protein